VGRKRLLIVDDEKQVREAIEVAFENHFDVFCAASPQEGLRFFEQ
jgi:DNA-binding response OmpR family regulator